MKYIHLIFLDSPLLFSSVSGTKDTSFFFSDKPHLLLFLHFSIPSVYNGRTGLGLGVIIYSIMTVSFSGSLSLVSYMYNNIQ